MFYNSVAAQQCMLMTQAEAASVVKTACLVNLANCAHKEQQYGEALDWCNKALRCCSPFALLLDHHTVLN